MRQSGKQFLLAIFLVLTGAFFAHAETGGMSLLPGADYAGGDYRTIKNTTLNDCQAVCLGDAKCKAFTFNTKANWCFLKSNQDIILPFRQAVAGARSQPTTIAKSLQPIPGFIDEALVNNAQDFSKSFKPDATSNDQFTAYAERVIADAILANNYQPAIDVLKQRIARGDNSYESWRLLTLALASQRPEDVLQSNSYNDLTTYAAINTYQHAVSLQQRAEALSLLGNALIYFSRPSQGIEAYRAAAKAYPTPPLMAALQDAKEKYGFRVLDFSVDADAAAPRVCVQFSEDLKKGRVDFMPYLSVAGTAPAAASANGRELCISGIKRGERTDLTVREGVPAENGDVTLKPVTLSIFIRDRAPAVNFANGTSYILPSAGRHGIPINSINVPEINVDLYYLPERSLAEFIRETRFLSALGSYEAEKIGNDNGDKVWSGTVRPEDKPGEEVITSFPLDEALKDRKPGVYIMQAYPPKRSQEDEYGTKATQWLLVSDIGLTTLSNQSGMTVFARSLNSAQPLVNIQLQLVARNNQVLATATTNEQGIASFDPGLMRGTGGNVPAILTASAGTDFGFLDLTKAAYDFSDRGVSGRVAPGPLDIFMYSDRGIYRPGHTLHLAAIARDDKAVAVTGLPLTFILYRPNEIEQQRFQLQDQGQGGYSFDYTISQTAMRGSWVVRAYTDPKKPAIAELNFRVDDFLPERIEFDLKSAASSVALDRPTEATVNARFLYGKPAAGLGIEGDLILEATRTLTAYPGYQFGVFEKNGVHSRTSFDDLGTTDDQGNATLSVQPSEIPVTTQPLNATLAVRVKEGSGRVVEQSLNLPVVSTAPLLGIKPHSAEIAENSTPTFDVIAIDGAAQRIAYGPVKWQLLRVRHDYQWYSRSGQAGYESVEYTDRVANGEGQITADQPLQLSSSVDWGEYRLVVESQDPTGAIANYDFSAGWYVAQTSTDTPDSLEIALDKPSYKIGDTATLRIKPHFAGTALINVVGETLIETKAVEVAATGAEIPLTVTEAWGPGTYVTASLLRPATDASKMPGRAIGVTPFKRDETARTLTIKMDPPPQIIPRTTLLVPVTVSTVPAGEQVHLTIAAVDVGVLNVTNFTPPDADGWFYGARKLAMEFRDIYGRLINGDLGTAGAIRSGGDGEGGGALGPQPVEVVALYSGIVTVGDNGEAIVPFDVPQFNGTLRLMAVAWSKTAVGDASQDVVVRDPVVVSESLPRVLAPGDRARLRLEFDNTDGPEGDYQLSLKTSEGLSLSQPDENLTLTRNKRVVVERMLLANDLGAQSISATLTNSSGAKIIRDMVITVRPGQPNSSVRKIINLAPHQSYTVPSDLMDQMSPGSAQLSVAITRAGGLDIPGILQALDRYPYGCSEQTTSRALPLLYLADIAKRIGQTDEGQGDNQDVKARVQKAIYRLLDNQHGGGSFGLWSPYDSNDDIWLNAYIMEFLTRAREQGYEVPDVSMNEGLSSLQSSVATTMNNIEWSSEISTSNLTYALYVLARNKQAAIGDLRFIAETKLDSLTSPTAKAQLGAALALYGDKSAAEKIMAAAVKSLNQRKEENWYRSDYGSNLRDTAAVLTYLTETTPQSTLIAPVAQKLVAQQNPRKWLSTQEEAWMLLAAHGLLTSGAEMKLSLNGNAVRGDFIKDFTKEELATPQTFTNDNDTEVAVVINVSGSPKNPEPAGGDGFSIERQYFNLDGTEADLSKLAQNDRLLVTVKIRQDNNWPSKILITDLLPAGLEIDNPSLVSSASLANFDWLQPAPEAHLEFRDDRFTAALNREDNSQSSDLIFAYVVRAVTPGSYIHPPALVEDMYRPYLNARTNTGLLVVK